MVTARTPAGSWVDEGLRALAAGGPDAVRVEALAKARGVTKGGFYWHFADRAALLDALLDAWERRLVDEVIDEIDALPQDPRGRLRHLYGRATSDPDVLLIDLAVRDWARRDAAVAGRLRRADTVRMAYLRELFRGVCGDDEEVEVRAMLAFSLWIGNHFIAAEHDARSREQVLALVMDRLLT